MVAPLLKNSRTKALLTFMLVLFFNLTNAQTTFFNADFENGTGVNAWTSSSTGANTSSWLRGVDNAQHNRPFVILLDPGTGNTTSCMYTQRHGGVAQYQNNTNIQTTSPVIDFSGYENITLSIDTRTDSENNIDGMRLEYRLNGGAWNNLGNGVAGWYDGTVSALGSNGWDGGNTNSQWQTRSINISAQDINFNGNECTSSN